MARIAKVGGRRILNSRGQETIEVEMTTEGGETVTASSPEGVSAGQYEARAISVNLALARIDDIRPSIEGSSFGTQRDFDRFLLDADGTSDKSHLGANLTLALSVAHIRAEAKGEGMPLWSYIREVMDLSKKTASLRLFSNMINGGLHGGGKLAFQEHIVVPRSLDLEMAIKQIGSIYAAEKTALKERYGPGATNVGDEGGFVPPMEDPLEPFVVMSAVCEQLGLTEDVDFALDAAANEVSIPAGDLFALYATLAEQFAMHAIEDPFEDVDFDNFALLKRQLNSKADHVLIVGDDLTATNTERMRLAKEKDSVNAVIIKPNQIGTVTEAIKAVRLAREYGWEVICSHRGGDTNDDFIADFAVGIMADGLKLGSPARGERVAKYNRLLKIADDMAQ